MVVGVRRDFVLSHIRQAQCDKDEISSCSTFDKLPEESGQALWQGWDSFLSHIRQAQCDKWGISFINLMLKAKRFVRLPAPQGVGACRNQWELPTAFWTILTTVYKHFLGIKYRYIILHPQSTPYLITPPLTPRHIFNNFILWSIFLCVHCCWEACLTGQPKLNVFV